MLQSFDQPTVLLALVSRHIDASGHALEGLIVLDHQTGDDPRELVVCVLFVEALLAVCFEAFRPFDLFLSQGLLDGVQR